jgi:DNA-directed RNA polymerase subunit RPC12/RpoP
MAIATDNYKCPSCGADMHLDQSNGMLHCNICNRNDETYTEDEEIVEYNFENAVNTPENNEWGLKTNKISCGKCKSFFIYPEGRTPAVCAYCGSQSLTLMEPSPTMRPDFLIPFKHDVNKSVSAITKWIKRKILAPGPLKNDFKGISFYGVYIPYWSFESETKSTYTGQAGDKYKDNETTTATVKGKTEAKTQKVSKLRWRFVSGSYDRKFKDVLYNDSQFNQKMLKKLEPFKLNELVKYETKLIEGFAAENYKTGLIGIWERAKDFMRKSIQREVHSTIKRGSDLVGKINISTKYTDIKYRLLLLPVWISSYAYKGKTYTAYINGQTGEIKGRSPKSPLRIAILVLIIAASLAALYFFVLSPLVFAKK